MRQNPLKRKNDFMHKFLEQINSPEDLKNLKPNELEQVAGEIREQIISVTSKKGGHLAASLGAVELAITLHYVLESPKDKILWDCSALPKS